MMDELRSEEGALFQFCVVSHRIARHADSLRWWLDRFLNRIAQESSLPAKAEKSVINLSYLTMSDGSDKELKYQYLVAREIKAGDARCALSLALGSREGLTEPTTVQAAC